MASEKDKKKVPEEIGGYDGSVVGEPGHTTHARRTIKYLEKRVEEGKTVNNELTGKLRECRKVGQEKINVLRDMYEKQTEELVQARLKLDKYIIKCDDLEDELDSIRNP